MAAAKHIWFLPAQIEAGMAALAAHFGIAETRLRSLSGRELVGPEGHLVMRARWALCLSLAEINDRAAPDIAFQLGFYISPYWARRAMDRCLDRGLPDDAEWDIALAAIGAAEPGAALRLAAVPPPPPPAPRKPMENEWSRGELAVLRDGLSRGDTYAVIAARLPGRSRNAAIGQARRLGWSAAMPCELSKLPGMEAAA